MSSKVFPSTGEKPKFDPNAAFQAVQDPPVPKGKKPVFNPNEKFEPVTDKQPVQKSGYSMSDIHTAEQLSELTGTPIAKQAQPFKPMSDWLNIQPGYQPMDQANVVAIDDHTKHTAQSAERVNEHLRSIDPSIHNLIYGHKKELGGRLKSAQLGVNPKEMAPLNPQAAELDSKLRQDVVVDPLEIEEYKAGMNENPGMVRVALDQRVKDLSKTNPAQANQLKGDVYRLDAQDRSDNEKKIAKNIEKLNEGKLEYDTKRGVLYKPEGFFQSIVTGFKQKNQLFSDYELYTKTDNEAAIIKELNEKLKTQDPDDAIVVPDGHMAEIGAMLGGQPIKPIVGAIGAGIATSGLGAAAAGGAISAHEMYKLGYASALPSNYAAIKGEHPDMPDYEAYQQAKTLAEGQAYIDAASGAAMGLVGARAAFKPTTSLLLQKSVKSALKQIGETVAIEGVGGGAVGAGGQIVKNLMAQKAGIDVSTTEGAAEQLVNGVMTTLGMSLAAKAGHLLKPSTYNRLLHGLSRLPEETIVNEFARAQEAGALTPEEAQKVQKDISEQKAIDASIPENVPADDRMKISSKIDQRNYLNKQLETLDASFHPEIKEQIKALNEEIVNISKGGERGDLQKLVDAEKKSGNIDGFVTDVLVNASEKDLSNYFKEISEQASDPNSEATTIATFGEAIVNKAKELYPAKEPEVIQPQPEASKEPTVLESTAASTDAQLDIPPPEITGSGEPPLPSSPEAPLPPLENGTQLSFRGLQDTANEFGFEDVRSRDPKTDLQTRANAEKTANEWAAKGEYQKNVDDLLGKIERREMVATDEQRLILEQYLANEKQKARELPKSSPEYDKQLLKLQRIKDIGQSARSEAAAALRLPDEGSRVHPINDEADAMVAKMKSNEVDKLTDQQKAEVEAQVEKYKKSADEANAKVAALEEQTAKLDAEKEFKKAKSTTKRVKKTAEERVAYRKGEIDAAREALRKLRSGESGLSAVPLPGVRELMAIAPHVKNIMVDLVAQGVDNLQDVVKQLHSEFKDVLDGVTEKDIHDVIAGKYNEKGRPLSVLQGQIKDIQTEAKLINQLESLQNGKEPKAERAKRERNQKIKELKDKIKGFRQEQGESEKFYGESNAGEIKLDKLRDELDRVQSRREKEKPAKDSQAEKEISSRQQEIEDQIKEAQAEWGKEKASGKQAKSDYARLEAERNRQLQKVADLKEKLGDLQKGVKSKGGVPVKKVDTPEIEALKKQVDDAEKELNKTVATEKRIKGLEDELDRLQQRKEKEPKEVNSREVTDREKELNEQIEAERKAIRAEEVEANKFYKEELDDDTKKLIAIKKRNQKREQEIKEKIANGRFEDEVNTSIFDRDDIKKTHPRLRKDALDAIVKKEDAQHEFDLALFTDEMERRSRIRKTADFAGKLLHTTKAVMSGIDDSATFVQNGLAMLANPKTGAKVWVEHWKDAFNDARFKRELSAIHQRPDWEIIKKSELDIVEPHSAASKQVEEAFEKNLLAGKFKINGKEFQPWKYTGGIFERAFTSMGNNMRLALFEKQMAALNEAGKTFESHPKEFKDAARVINELTGRGKLPAGVAQAAPYITPFIWAPRMLTATINTLGLGEVMGLGGKGYYQNLTPMQRKFALSQLGRGVAMGVGVMSAAALGGAKVDYDPRSVTFGDVIMGDHHYNVFGRYTPVVKALVQFTMGERVKKDGVQDLDSGKRGAKTRMGVVGGFFRGKMTPATGAAYDLVEGKNYFTNKPFGVSDLPAALTTPMSIKELKEGWKNDGTWTILNRFLPAFEGLKVSDERGFEKESSSGSGQKNIHKQSGRKLHNSNPHKRD